jgi:hypothetical protein
MNSNDIFYLKIEKYLTELKPDMSFISVTSLANDTELFIILAKEIIRKNNWTDIEFSCDYTGIRKLPPLPVWAKTHYVKRKTA